MDHTETASVRYMIDDVPAAIAFYTEHLGFTLETDASPAFASVVRGPLRLLLSGARSSGRGRCATAARRSRAAGLASWCLWTTSRREVARLREAGLTFRNEIVKGVGGSQALLDDPSGNPVELFQPG